jgi:hypothetical protein
MGAKLVRGFLLSAILAATQPTFLHDDIHRIYGFEPHLLTDQQRQQKSGIMDQFWEKAKARKPVYITALRQELQDFSNPSFFLYDGSVLLLSLSDTHEDRQSALAAFARCALRDVQLTDYFMQVHRMAALNEDTTAAAFHILDEPGFQVFIPQHSLTLAQDYSLVYLLLPADPTHWLDPAIARLRSERDETAQKSLVLMLWYAQTDAADKAIRAFASDTAKPSTSRAYAQQMMGRKASLEGLEATQRAEALASSDALLRQKRRDRLKAVSDEALFDLDAYTKMLMVKRSSESAH